tara:strand:+ start:893 stop:1096 length:204 start_codon:yes stop_codon:yes gene_type:complete
MLEKHRKLEGKTFRVAEDINDLIKEGLQLYCLVETDDQIMCLASEEICGCCYIKLSKELLGKLKIIS